jgi:hypothetical protein
MRKNEPRDAWLTVTLRLERELAAVQFAKISAKKCPDPRASAFGNGKDNGFATGKLACPATEIAAYKLWQDSQDSRTGPQLRRRGESRRRSGLNRRVGGDLGRLRTG